MSADVLKSFFVELGFKVDKDGQRKVDDALGAVTKAAGALALALEGAVIAAAAAFAKITSEFDKLYFASQRTGASANNLKALSYAFGQVGASGDAAVGAVSAFSAAMRTNPGVGGFLHSIGVATQANGQARDSFAVLADAVDVLKRKFPGEGNYFIRQNYATRILGLSEEQFQTFDKFGDKLREFRAEYERTAQRIGLNNDEAAAQSNKFWTAMRGLGASIQAVAEKIFTDFAPALTQIVQRFREWIETHPDEIRQIVVKIAEGAVALGKGLADCVQWLTGDHGAISGFKLFGEVLGTLVLARLLGISRILGGLSIPGWIAALLGLSAGAQASTAMGKGGLTGGVDPITGEGGGDMPGGVPQAGEQAPWLRRQWRRFRNWMGGASGGTTRIGKLAQNANAGVIMDELRKAGYNDNAIAAIVGSMQTESTFNPRAHNDASGGHTGLWQWDRTRWPKVAAWIKGQGGDPYDPRWQAKAWIAEHNAKPGDAIYDHPRTQRGGAILRGNPSLEDAIHGVRESERFGPGEEGGRAANARGWLPHVRNTSGAPPSPAAPPPPTPVRPMPSFNMTPGGFDVNKLGVTPMGGTSSATHNTTTITQAPQTSVVIHGAGDAHATADAVERAVKRAQNMPLPQAQSPVR